MPSLRKATSQERMQMVEQVLTLRNQEAVRFTWEDVTYAFRSVGAAYIAVFDDSGAEAPGDVGKVILVISPAGPGKFTVYTVDGKE